VTLTGRVTAASLAVLFACLVVVGVGVAGVLQVRAVRSLDQALLAAAFAEAHPWQEERFASDHARSPVSVRPWRDGDPRVPKVLYDQAVGQDLPRWHLLDGYRVLLLVVAPEGSGGQQLVVVAEAPEVTTWEAVGPFAVAYTVVAGMALLLAAVAVRWAMVRALQPLSDASEAIGRVRQLGSHERLASSGAAEVDRLIGSTNALLERLERAYRAQSSFTAQAAHELRTPVTVLKGELELALRRERDAADYRSTLERATGEVERLARLVDGLMALARVEAGQVEQGRVRERLSAVLAGALAAERAGLEAAGCSAVLVLDADPELSLHLELARTAVANLLRNVAVHAPGAHVELRTEGVDGHAVVHVDDDGPGLPAAAHGRVVERFGHGPRSGGLGIGLALAREVAERHGGGLILGASPLGGLRVSLSLPISNQTPMKH